MECQLRELEMEEAGEGGRHDRLEDEVVAYESVRSKAPRRRWRTSTSYPPRWSMRRRARPRAASSHGRCAQGAGGAAPRGRRRRRAAVPLLGGGGGAGVADGEGLGAARAHQARAQAEGGRRVQVPLDAALAKSVLQVDAAATQERQALKRQILAAAADHESAGPTYIQQIRQKEFEAGTPGGTKQLVSRCARARPLANTPPAPPRGPRGRVAVEWPASERCLGDELRAVGSSADGLSAYPNVTGLDGLPDLDERASRPPKAAHRRPPATRTSTSLRRRARDELETG